jgi:tyrosinase
VALLRRRTVELSSRTRRQFVKTSACALALTAIPCRTLFGQTLSQRLDWDTFKTTSQYASFVTAIARMRSNTNASDPRSWVYWTNAHLNYCPHGIPYFLVWHRGYLYYFEQYLRTVSGNATLTLPYWDYYKNPVIPAEFTNPSSNPLYVSRVNTNVSQALTSAPFSNTLINFPRGTINSFEPSVERKPHDPVHDIIGGVMGTMQSPQDPIFWLHHANIDRLWNAWVNAGNGRLMPASGSSYWSGTLTYGPSMTMNRSRTINTRSQLGYYYQNEGFPPIAAAPARRKATQRTELAAVMPVSAAALAATQIGGGTDGARAPGMGWRTVAAIGGALLADTLQAAPDNRIAKRSVIRPPVRNLPLSAQRPTDSGRLSLGGVRNVQLDETSFSTRVLLDAAAVRRIGEIVSAAKAFVGAPEGTASPPSTTAQVVLDDVRLTDVGQNGGFYYNVYLNMPDSADSEVLDERYLLGTLGNTAIQTALHHAAQHGDHARGSMGSQSGSARLVFPATRLLLDATPDTLAAMTISFDRVSGDTSPSGTVITIGEVRIELSSDTLE